MAADGVFTPACVLAEALRRREVSSFELVEVYLAQISRHNPDLNAVVTLGEEGVAGALRTLDQGAQAYRGARGYRVPVPDGEDLGVEFGHAL